MLGMVDTALVAATAPVVLAILGVVALKLYLDARHRERSAGEPELIQQLKAHIQSLEVELNTERRRRAAYQGGYNAPPPDMDLDPDAGEGLGDVVESITGNVPAWLKPLLNNPTVQDTIAGYIERNPDALANLIDKLKPQPPLAKPTNTPPLTGM